MRIEGRIWRAAAFKALPSRSCWGACVNPALRASHTLVATEQSRQFIPQRFESDRFGNRQTFPKSTPPPADAVPPSELESDLFINSEKLKSERLVKSNAAVIGQRDPCKRGMEMLPLQCPRQSAVERSSNTAPPRLFDYVDTHVDGPSISGPLTVSSCVRVTE